MNSLRFELSCSSFDSMRRNQRSVPSLSSLARSLFLSFSLSFVSDFMYSDCGHHSFSRGFHSSIRAVDPLGKLRFTWSHVFRIERVSRYSDKNGKRFQRRCSIWLVLLMIYFVCWYNKCTIQIQELRLNSFVNTSPTTSTTGHYKICKILCLLFASEMRVANNCSITTATAVHYGSETEIHWFLISFIILFIWRH